MIKGHVCIDLHNHRSGFTERIEGNNTVTSALQTILNYYATTNYGLSNLTPLATNLFSGMCMFDKQLNNQMYAPGDSKIIASGYSSQNTDTDIVGSYNSLESGRNGNVYTHVWDFATNQGNGDIQSVAIVPSLGGSNPFNPWFMLSKGYSFRILYYDETNEDLYFNYTNDASPSTIYKTHLPLTSINIFRNAGDLDVVENTGKTYAYNVDRCISGGDGYIYRTHFDNQRNLKIYRIKVSDLSFEEESSPIVNATLPVDSSTMVAINLVTDKVYVKGSDDNIYVIDMSTSAVAQVTAVTGLNYESTVSVTPTGIVIIGGRYADARTYRINTDGIIQGLPIVSGDVGQGAIAPTIYTSNGIAMEWDYTSRTGIFTQLLLTNYNLPSVITKSNNQSMKVTYTLTQQ